MPSRLRELARRHLPPAVRRAAIRMTGDRLSEQTPQRTGDQKATKPGPKAVAAAGAAGQETPITEVLRRGGSLAEAVVAQARADVSGGGDAVAVAVSTALGRQPETADVGALAAGIVAYRRGFPELAWEHLSRLPVELWSAHAPEEYVRAGLALDAGGDVGGGPGTGGCRAVVRRTRRLAGHARTGVRSRRPRPGRGRCSMHSTARSRTGDGSDRRLVVNRDWLRPWVAGSPDDRSAPPVASDAVSFAIMDYGHPGRSRASANIGDHVQSLASLGHLVRHSKLEFSGPQDLVDLVRQLQGRVRPERQLDDVAATVQLLAVDRDASEFAEIPPNTWTLAFGWFMHAIFDMRYGFPFHPNLLPLFVSFHCSKRDLLTDDAIKYLRQYSPIGCRDWTTVDVLLSVGRAGVLLRMHDHDGQHRLPGHPAEPRPDAQVAYVDIPPAEVPDGAPTYKHSDDGIRFRSFAANMYDAIELLETYRRRHSGLVTSRLHCYLPGPVDRRTRGLPAEEQVRPEVRRADRHLRCRVRPDQGDDQRASCHGAVRRAVAGRPPEAVYELWRELNAADVEAARRRHEAPAEMSSPKVDLLAEISHVRSTQPTTAWRTTPSRSWCTHAAPSQQALRCCCARRRAQQPTGARTWVARPAGPAGWRRALRWRAGDGIVVGTAGLGQDLRRGGGGSRHPATSTCSSAGGASSVDRLVVLPADAVVLGDVAELADLDLGVTSSRHPR